MDWSSSGWGASRGHAEGGSAKRETYLYGCKADPVPPTGTTCSYRRRMWPVDTARPQRCWSHFSSTHLKLRAFYLTHLTTVGTPTIRHGTNGSTAQMCVSTPNTKGMKTIQRRKVCVHEPNGRTQPYGLERKRTHAKGTKHRSNHKFHTVLQG